MKQLSDRNYLLIEEAAKITGNYLDAYHYIEERLYVDEAETIFKFLSWCNEDPATRGFGHGNYKLRFQQFLNFHPELLSEAPVSDVQVSERKFSPGPWYISGKSRRDEYKTVITGGQYNGIIAEAKSNVYTDIDTAEANAKLIAAAPDLLEALVSACKLLNTWADDVKFPTIKHIEAVIKKATE